ncbi:MAG: hypothetical protein AB7G15_06810 [Alphaproteobacteria bacterium]
MPHDRRLPGPAAVLFRPIPVFRASLCVLYARARGSHSNLNAKRAILPANHRPKRLYRAENPMLDVLVIALGVFAFALFIGYVAACDRL